MTIHLTVTCLLYFSFGTGNTLSIAESVTKVIFGFWLFLFSTLYLLIIAVHNYIHVHIYHASCLILAVLSPTTQ